MFCSDNIRAEKGRAGMTWEEIADKLDITATSLRHKVKGRREFNCSELVALSELFDKPIDYLVGNSVPSKPKN